MDTCFNYCSSDRAFFSSDERKWINRVRKLSEDFPDQVQITKEPDENDGCIYASVPAAWLKVQPPKKMNFTEEQKNAFAERLRVYRETKEQP